MGGAMNADAAVNGVKGRSPKLDVAELRRQAKSATSKLAEIEKVPVPADVASDALLSAPVVEAANGVAARASVADAVARTTSSGKRLTGLDQVSVGLLREQHLNAVASAASATADAEVSSSKAAVATPAASAEHGSEPVGEEAIHGHWVSPKGECKIGFDSMTRRLNYEEFLDGGGRLHGWLVQEGNDLCWQSALWILDEDQLPWYGPSFGEEPERVGDIMVRLLPGPPVRLQTQIRVMDEDTDWQAPVTFAQLGPGESVDVFGPFGPSPGPMVPAETGGLFVFGGGAGS